MDTHPRKHERVSRAWLEATGDRVANRRGEHQRKEHTVVAGHLKDHHRTEKRRMKGSGQHRGRRNHGKRGGRHINARKHLRHHVAIGRAERRADQQGRPDHATHKAGAELSLIHI